MAISIQDFQQGFDPTGLQTISAAQLLELITSAEVAAGRGLIITTEDALGVPEVPDAVSTTKFQRYLWRRVASASITIYVWNPYKASDVTYLKWDSIVAASIGAGTILNYMIADNTITDAKIANVDWSKIINAPTIIASGSAAGGDLTGTYPNPTIAGGVISTAKLANGAVTVDKLADNAVETVKIKDQNVTTGKIADVAVTASKAAEAFRNDSHNYASGIYAAGVYSVTLAPAATVYSAGMEVVFKADTANTGAVDLNINDLGVKNLYKNVTTELAANDIPINAVVTARYDGTNFQMLGVAGVLTGNYSSAETTPASGLIINAAHGLGSTPRFLLAVLKCIDAGGDLGYAQNDEVTLSHCSPNSSVPEYQWGANATNVFLRCTTATPAILDKGTGAYSAITTAKWKFILRAIL